MPRLRHISGAIAAALVFSASAHATQFDQIVVFGDSLSDNGNVSALTPGSPRMRFTTNPGHVAVEDVADKLGLTLEPSSSGGTDYAYGGARSSIDMGPLISASTQVNNYLTATGGKADPDALYSMWIGANDILDANPATAQADLITAANHEVATLQKLQAAGARNIVVFNLPDVSNTPAVHGTPLAEFAGQLGDLYNATLNDGVGTLGVGIIPVNSYDLLNEVIADPATYGFTNVTQTACTTASSIACTPDTLREPNAGQTYLFADGVHPTTAAHAMLAQVVLSELNAPGQVSRLAEAPLASAAAHMRTVHNQMLIDNQGSGTRAFAAIDYGKQRFDATGNSPNSDSNNTNLTVGVDVKAGDNVNIGVVLGASRNNLDVAHGGGGFRLNSLLGSAYAVYHQDGGYIGAHVGYARLDYNDVQRGFDVGAAHRVEGGSTDGSQWLGGISAGWEFGSDAVRTGPFAGIKWQRVGVKGYAEHGDDSTAMYFGEQKRTATIATLGWGVSGSWQTGSSALHPFAEVAFNHDSDADPRYVHAGLNTINGTFELRGYTADSSWVSANLGLSADFSAHVSGWLAYNGRFGDSNQKLNSLNLGLKIAF